MTGDLHADANMFANNVTLSIREHVMNVDKYKNSVRIPISNLRYDHYVDMISQELVYNLQSFFIKSQSKHDYANICPKSAWQHIKLDYAPKWFLRMFPVEYRTVSLWMTRVYPEFPLNERQLGQGFVTFVSHKASNKLYENT